MSRRTTINSYNGLPVSPLRKEAASRQYVHYPNAKTGSDGSPTATTSQISSAVSTGVLAAAATVTIARSFYHDIQDVKSKRATDAIDRQARDANEYPSSGSDGAKLNFWHKETIQDKEKFDEKFDSHQKKLAEQRVEDEEKFNDYQKKLAEQRVEDREAIETNMKEHHKGLEKAFNEIEALSKRIGNIEGLMDTLVKQLAKMHALLAEQKDQNEELLSQKASAGNGR